MCGIDYLDCQGQLFVNNPLYVKRNDEHNLDIALHVYRFLGLDEFELSLYAHDFSPQRLSNHCQFLRCTISEIFTKLYAVLCRIHREITSGQMYDSKQKDVRNQHID
jgi:hypothetical protein